MDPRPRYVVVLADGVDEPTARAFHDLELEVHSTRGPTVLVGQLDHAALHGLFARIRSHDLALYDLHRTAVHGVRPW